MTAPNHELPPELQAFFQAARAHPPRRDPARAARARAAFLAQVRALAPEPETRPQPRVARPWGWFTLRPRLAWALALLLLAFTVGLPTAHAAQRALPGSPLYPLKRWGEAARLALVRDPAQRATLLLNLAETRVTEARALLTQGETTRAQQVLADLDAYLAELQALPPDLHPQLADQEEHLSAELLTTAALAPPGLRDDLLQVANGWAALHAQALQRHAENLTFLVGPVEAIEGQVWQVGGRTVHMGPETLVYGVPQEGDLVEVLGAPNPDGSWTALEVRIAARVVPGQSAQVEFVGRLEAQSPSRWRVNGLELEVQPNADILGMPRVGDWVEVAALWDARSGRWVLWHAEPVAEVYGVEVEFSGRLTAQEGDLWWIAGLPVQVTEQTRFTGPRPQVGDWVVVHAWRQADGTLLAEEMHPIDAPPPDEDDATPTLSP